MDNDIKEACKIMQEGGLILYPTDTIWGIGCDATNELAVKRVYEIKKRIDSKALIVLVDSPAKIDFYTDHVPDIAWDLVEVADKPLTIVYPNARNLAHNLLAEDGSVGIRIKKNLSHTNFAKDSEKQSSRHPPISVEHPLPVIFQKFLKK